MDEARVSRRRLLAGTGTALAAALAGCSLGAPQQRGDPDAPGNFPTEFQDPPENPREPVVDSELGHLYQAVVDSVAAVRLEEEFSTGGGTAWVLDDSFLADSVDDGDDTDFLVTNEHVVSEGDEPFVWFTEVGWREASVRGVDRHSDLAVLTVEGKPSSAEGLTLVEAPVAVGTPVLAVGNPFGLTGSFTSGIVSGRNRNIDLPDRDFSIADGVQTDAALNPGNSGGPLVTHDGEVAGVVSAGQGENVGFAVSAAMARNVLPDLVATGEYEHSYLGVLLRDVTPELIEANSLDVTWGVYIDEILTPGPSADRLRGSESQTTVRDRTVPTGGDVILGMSSDTETWPIQTRERLSAFLALRTEPGDIVDIEVLRDGERQHVDVELGRRQDARL